MDLHEFSREELARLCADAIVRSGGSAEQASVLAEATVVAEERGLALVGVRHLVDYLDGLATGRISADTPVVRRRTPILQGVDCRGGIAQQGFEAALPDLLRDADANGLAVVAMANAFTVGELGYYVRRLTERGYFAIAVANSPALMSVAGAAGPVLGTNPHAFGVPLPDGRRIHVDQASSATAWVAVRDAAAEGRSIPEGLAVDSSGQPTTSATDGLAGALLPFGSYKGGNVAFLVEIIATMAGGTFSADAPPFDRGTSSPAVGCVVLALSLSALAPGYPARLAEQLGAWRSDLGADPSVWIERDPAAVLRVPAAVVARLTDGAWT